MKSKLKAPEVAKTKGADYVKTSLKKRLKEPFEEGSAQFLYDAEFDYGPTMGGKSPMLFVGELSSEWRKYLKENKAKPSVAAGRCAPDKKAPDFLNIEVKAGKGGKEKFLKMVNKDLLKPFAEARFVESIESGKVLNGDIPEIAAEPETGNENGKDLEAEATNSELLEDGEELLKALTLGKTKLETEVNTFTPIFKDVSRNIITKAIITQSEAAALVLDEHDIEVLIVTSDTWLQGEAKKEMANDKAISELYGKIVTIASALKTLKPKVIALYAGFILIQKVSGPSGPSGPTSAPAAASASASAPPPAPISKNPLNNFRSSMSAATQKYDSFGSIGDALSVTQG